MTDEEETKLDLDAGRRVELALSDEFLVALQYFPEFDNISLSFYTKNNPGFTMGMTTDQWPAFQSAVAAFVWRGRRQ